ncbi:MAG: FMN-binding protein [Oscillospiraceae bacterium]
MFKEKIQPSLVLTLICLITCALLVIAYNATYVDNTGVVTNEMTAGLEEIYGTSEGFTMKTDENGAVYAPEGVTCVLTDANGNRAFEITTDGYSSGGIHVLVGMDASGTVSGISVLSLGETPGLGTKVRDLPEFREQFKGLTSDKLPKAAEEDNSPKKFVWGSDDEIKTLKDAAASAPVSDTFELDAVTGATFSSKGMYRAVTIALNAYNEMEGVTVSE